MIKFFGLDRQYATLKTELLDATDKVLSTGQVLDGEHVKKFEESIAQYTDRKYAVAVNSCSQSLLFTFMAYASMDTTLHGAKVAIPTVSFAATANAPSLVAFEPYFVDVDDEGLLDIDQLDIKKDNIKLLLYVNLFGNIIDYDRLKLVTDFFHGGMPIIEDAAQSFGGSVNGVPSGKLGTVSCLSFDPTKNLPNYGSGGMLLTDDEHLYKTALNLRDNGKVSGHGVLGTNSKMSEVDCAHMNIKLKQFDTWQSRRRDIADYYTEHLSQFVITTAVKPNVKHAWHKYVVKTPDQYKLRDHLQDRGVETKIHYETPLALHPIFDQYSTGRYPSATALSQQVVSLPIYPELTDSEVEHIVSSVKSFYR